MNRISATGKPRLALVQFPGSNCDTDTMDALARHFGIRVQTVWHTETSLPPADGVVLPGGFSYGDYLRSGSLASHAPIMASVKTFVHRGGAAIGICNGFQVLTESHLLPGALLANASRRFVCRHVWLKPEAPSGHGPSNTYQASLVGRCYRVPVAHGEGRYYIDPEGLRRLKDRGQIVFRYVDEDGELTSDANPNGSVDNIAGVASENGRVLGLMPHPERATDQVMGGSRDGLAIWEAFLASFS